MSSLAPLNLPKTQPLERRPDLLDPSRPRIENVVKAKRYRAGQVPDYAKEALLSPPEKDFSSSKRRRVSSASSSSSSSSDKEHGADNDSSDGDLDERMISSSKPRSQYAEAGLRRRRVRPSENVTELPSEELVAEVLPDSGDEMEGIEETEAGRDAAQLALKRQEMRKRRLEEEQRLRSLEEAEGGSGDEDIQGTGDDSSSSQSSDSDDEGAKPLPKPVYKSKEERVALREAVLAEIEQQKRLEEEEARRREEKEATSKQLLKEKVEMLEKEDEAIRLRRLHGVVEDAEDMILPDDEIHDEDEEFRLWKLREMGRLYRDELVEERYQRELEETERRKQMTEEELLEDNKRRDKEKAKLAQQGKMNYMQKYYHKGVFFQDVVETGKEKVFDKDFNAPVGEDAVDKSYLPAAMRLRRGEFGRKGRSKHTHLADVDTTDRTSPWYRRPPTESKKPNNK